MAPPDSDMARRRDDGPLFFSAARLVSSIDPFKG
jgi:hypothetical protein